MIKFESPLTEGLIKSRPNRFIMLVDVAGKEERCHCPSTGRIGGIVFKDVPCLLSKSENSKRTTNYTVEAISLDALEKKHKSWIGINQNKTNDYIAHFIENNKLKKMVRGEVKREVPLGKSRIDFKVGDAYLEAKTPLIALPSGGTSERKESKFDSFDRLIKHYSDLAKVTKGARTIVALCYQYDAPAFVPPKTDASNSRIKNSVKAATNKGVENWQINMRINEQGVELLDYFPLDLTKTLL